MAGHFWNSAGDSGIMGYMVFSFTVNHLISIFLVFILSSGIRFFSVLPVQPGKLRYKKRYEIAGFLYRSRCRYEKFRLYRPVRYWLHCYFQITRNIIKLFMVKVKPWRQYCHKITRNSSKESDICSTKTPKTI